MSKFRCLAQDCDRLGLFRGLCSRHYEALRREVKAGKTTWAAAIQAGRCLEPKGREKWLHRKRWP